MKSKLLFLALFTWVLQATAQDKTVDQLKKELATLTKQDKKQVDKLLELSFSTSLSLSERENYCAEALTIARKTGYTYGEGIALTNLGYYKLRQGKIEGDSLLKLADDLATRSGDYRLAGMCEYRKGMKIFTTTGKRECLDHFTKAEEAFVREQNYRRLFDCQTAIADFYQNFVSNYPLAMEYLMKSIQSAEKAKSSRNLTQAWLNLGSLYSLLGDHANAIMYSQKAAAENKKNADPTVLEPALYNVIGESYRMMGKYPEAIRAYEQSVVHEILPLNHAINESNLAEAYMQLDSFTLAFHHVSLAREKLGLEQAPVTYLYSWLDGVMGRAYIKRKMADSAIYYARRGLDTAVVVGNIEYMRDNTAILSAAYAQKKDFARAYDYRLQHDNYRDSMLSAEVRNKTAILQFNTDINKKQAEIDKLSEQKKAQRNFLLTALIALALIIFATALLLRNVQHKKKANRLLQSQKKEIDDKAHELSIQKDQLQQSYNNVELLGEIGRQVSSSLSVETIISTAYNNVNSLMDAAIFGIGIYHDETKTIDFPATFENGRALPPYSNSISDQNRLAGLCFISGREIVMGDLITEYGNYLQNLPTPLAGGQAVSLIYLPLKVKEKMFGVITVQSFKKNAFTEYHLYMLRNIALYTAIALENAESFKKLNSTVESLQKTQKQLVQSEKMASLGELTAGIAHEIQNPLNFVNNFSEVNKELIAEMQEEIEKGNYNEVRLIARHIETNQEKINHHGKRADAIVKGMLQHSRTGSGQKELTDINNLCDEYLRLAYHGLRAKDKNFNAKFETDFDAGIGKINIVPQDIGRVVLNLISNAFYAVNQKKKQASNGYEPIVTVTTKKSNGKIEIKVIDNGTGIPNNALDKIFQPFFTTKPTGEGTGLGLSLAYDIVKTHNGELKVETKEREGSIFIIGLPLN